MFSVKERCNISNCAYHEMSMISDLYSLSKAAKKTLYNYILWCTPGRIEGIQQSITEQLRVQICYILQSNPSF